MPESELPQTIEELRKENQQLAELLRSTQKVLEALWYREQLREWRDTMVAERIRELIGEPPVASLVEGGGMMESDPRILKERGDNEAIREAVRAVLQGEPEKAAAILDVIVQRAVLRCVDATNKHTNENRIRRDTMFGLIIKTKSQKFREERELEKRFRVSSRPSWTSIPSGWMRHWLPPLPSACCRELDRKSLSSARHRG